MNLSCSLLLGQVDIPAARIANENFREFVTTFSEKLHRFSPFLSNFVFFPLKLLLFFYEKIAKKYIIFCEKIMFAKNARFSRNDFLISMESLLAPSMHGVFTRKYRSTTVKIYIIVL